MAMPKATHCERSKPKEVISAQSAQPNHVVHIALLAVVLIGSNFTPQNAKARSADDAQKPAQILVQSPEKIKSSKKINSREQSELMPSFKQMAQSTKNNEAMPLDTLLAELSQLANQLEKQQQDSALLRLKIEELARRIHGLEQKQAANKSAEDAQRPDEQIPNSQAMNQKPKQPDVPEPSAREDEPSAKQPNEAEEDLQQELDKFFDLGESMLRRFFGLVREFRHDFEQNRV